MTCQKITLIRDIIHACVAPKAVPASQLQDDRHIKFHDRLDDILSGGIHRGQITEFVGKFSLWLLVDCIIEFFYLPGLPGSGKSQLCLQLAAANSLYGTTDGILYVDTEGAFSGKRLLEITMSHNVPPVKLQSVLEKVHVWRPQDIQQILDRMAEIETFIIKQQVGMLIIDSIGSITRRQFGQDKSIERGSALCSLSSHLKDVAHTLNIAVVITNHITSQSSSSGNTAPALGPSWSHWINNRIELSTDKQTKLLTISKSAELPQSVFPYTISTRGLQISTNII